MSKVVTFFQLPKREKMLFFNAIYLLAYYRLNLKLRPLQIVFADVQKRAAKVLPVISPAIPEKRIAWVLNVASRYIPYCTCLSMVLAGKILFAQFGYVSVVHIGVAKNCKENLDAHAWLTLGDKIVICHVSDLKKYKEFQNYVK
jgi:hypothetical protein